MCPLLVTEDVYFKKSGHQPNGADLLQRFATENQPNGGHLPYFLHKMSTFNKCHNQKKSFRLENVGTQDLGSWPRGKVVLTARGIKVRLKLLKVKMIFVLK